MKFIAKLWQMEGGKVMVMSGLVAGSMLTFAFGMSTVETSSAAEIPRTTRFLQAEAVATKLLCGSGFSSTTLAGYTGTGYSSCDLGINSSIEWKVMLPNTGVRQLRFRYRNDTNASIPVELNINGTVIQASMPFPSTGTLTTGTWASSTVEVVLAPGLNTIRVKATTPTGLPKIDRVDVVDINESEVDWGVAVVETTMLERPTAAGVASDTWNYTGGLVMYGVYQTYLRTRDVRYLDYVQNYFDSLIGTSTSTEGNIYANTQKKSVAPLSRVDEFYPARALAGLYSERPEKRYRIALQTLRNRVSETTNSPQDTPTTNTNIRPSWTTPYSRTSEGLLVHWLNTPSRPDRSGEIWLDGVYIGQNWMQDYATLWPSEKVYADNQAAKHYLTMAREDHNIDPVTGLIFHGYDDDGSANWVVPGTKRSPEIWCRGLGWYTLGIAELTDTISKTHPDREALASTTRSLASALINFQDPATGRWFQLVNRQSEPENWTETSCSAMHAYSIHRALRDGLVSGSPYTDAITKAYTGVLEKLSWRFVDALDAWYVGINDVVVGTSVASTTSYYYSRDRSIDNDPHGKGIFLFFWEEFKKPLNGVPTTTPIGPLSVNLSANPTSITGAGTTTLVWSATNADSCTASNGWSGAKSTTGGTETLPLSVTTSFMLTCTQGTSTSLVATTTVVVKPDLGGGTGTSTTALAITKFVVRDTANAADWSIQPNFSSSSKPFGDSSLTLSSVPSSLVGGIQIRTAVDSKDYPNSPLATFEVTKNGTGYVIIDDRKIPTWLATNGWTDTGTNLFVKTATGTKYPFSIYKRAVIPGEQIRLGYYYPGGSRLMYFVVVK